MLVISNELKIILNKISNQSIIALAMISSVREYPIKENHISYIGISDSDCNKISYLTPDRIDKIVDNSHWATRKRYHSKPGAVINKIFNNVPDVEVEKFVNLYKAEMVKSPNNFKIVDGDDIIKYYHGSKVYDNTGSLGQSCMKHDSCQEYLKIYADNIDKIKMLILFSDNNKVIGRALLWVMDNGKKVMDRVYTCNDDVYHHHFRRWASENGYIYRKSQKWNNSLQFIDGNKDTFEKMSIKLNYHNYRSFPYMDTFKFYDYINGVFYNYKPESDDILTLIDAGGGKFNSDALMFDTIDNVYHHKHEMRYLDYCDSYHYSGNLVDTIYGNYIHISHSFYSDKLRGYVFSKEYSNHNVQSAIHSRLIKNHMYSGDYKSVQLPNDYIFDPYNPDETIPYIIEENIVDSNYFTKKDDSVYMKKLYNIYRSASRNDASRIYDNVDNSSEALYDTFDIPLYNELDTIPDISSQSYTNEAIDVRRNIVSENPPTDSPSLINSDICRPIDRFIESNEVVEEPILSSRSTRRRPPRLERD